MGVNNGDVVSEKASNKNDPLARKGCCCRGTSTMHFVIEGRLAIMRSGWT